MQGYIGGVKMSDLLKLIHDLSEKVDKVQKDVIEKANVELMVKDIMDKQKKIPVRKSLFEIPIINEGRAVTVQKRITLPAKTDFDRELQELNDNIYITSNILKVHPTQLAMWQEFQAGDSELKKALDTATSGEGSDWIPTGFSASLIDLVRVQLKVANLFRRITMPTNPFKFPVVSADATGYLQSESIADEASKLRASTPTTTNLELSAVKLAARTLFSEEISEDSIVPILPWLREQIVLALATAEEKAVINGDTSTIHQDSNVTAAYDAQKAWTGLRKLVVSGAKVDCGTFNLDNLRSVRKELGKYGVDPSKLAYIVGLSGYIQLLGIKDSSSNQVVTTVDKYGPNATILTGELGKIDGSPIIVSENVYENLNASGVYDGTTTTKTIMLLAYTPAFIIGDRRRVTVKTAADIETDQQILVATQRLDFHPFYATTETMVGLAYNITA
jgi:HK97 family phage major capsid protein